MCGEPSASHDSLARGILEGGVGNQGAKPLDLGFEAAGGPGGSRPLPRAVRAMNGQLGFSRNRRHPSPDRDPPALLPSQGGSRRTAEANKPQGACLTRDKGAAPGAERGGRHSLHRTPPPPGAQAAARVGTVTPPLSGQRGRGASPRVLAPDLTSFFTFHSSFSLTASSALPMVRQVAGRRRPAAPRSPRALAASAPPGSAPHA